MCVRARGTDVLHPCFSNTLDAMRARWLRWHGVDTHMHCVHATAARVLPRLCLPLPLGQSGGLSPSWQNGERLGRGKGYYDTFLQRLAEGPSGDAAGRPENVRPKVPPYTIGIGFSVQLVDAIPTEPHDMKLDVVDLPTAATE